MSALNPSLTTVALFALLCSAGILACADARPARPAANAAPATTSDPTAYALVEEGNAAYEAKDYARCGALLGRAAERLPDEAIELRYDEACCHALAGNQLAGLSAIEQIVALGYRERERLERDDDLRPLRDDPRWARALARADANAAAYFKGANPELQRLHEEDQADRRSGPSGINWAEVTPRDEARRKRVRALLSEGGAKVSADYYHAAMVFQHGSAVDDFRASHDLAKQAAALDPRNRQAKWLAAASKDRELMALGRPQLYGTQFRKVEGRWELYQVDPSISDEERRRWNVPPIAQAKRRVAMLNAQP
jgi:hypothetical protein